MSNKNIIDTYKNIYNLSELTYKEEVDFDFFRLCKAEYNFVVISVYNERKEMLLLRDLNKNIGWELIGGYIKENENIEDAVNRIILKEAGLAVDELEPIAVLNNIFTWNNNSILHHGIAFVALSRGRIKSQPENVKIIYTKDLPDVMVYQNKRILDIVKKIINNKAFNPPYEEIEITKRFFLAHIINKHVVHVVGYLASRKIKKKILGLIFDKPKSIIDVCCGDDDFIFKLEKLYNPEICIANDISWKVLSLLKNKQKKSEVFLTNHNVITTPFNKKFDLVIFKNTLHHIPKNEQATLIKKLSTLSKQLIIIDVENPKKSNILTKIWHWYYLYFLGDKGRNFLTNSEFKEIIKDNINDKNLNFGIINTIKGRYFYGSLTDVINGEEVEIKVKIDSSKVKEIRKRIFDLRAIFKEKIEEKDSYFTAPHRDFIKTKECLRIRERDNSLELTYKGPSTDDMVKKKQFWKSEINISFNTTPEEIEMLLKFLDFRKIVEVKKEREKFVIGEQIITLDNIIGIGYFLEVETKVKNKEDREKALEKNIDIIRKIGLDEKDIVTLPYRDLVLEKQKQASM